MKAHRSVVRQRGYILALNIAVIAVMLVGAAYMGQRLHLALRLARMEEQRVSAEFALQSARAEALYLMAVIRRGNFGLGVLKDRAVALDGRFYRIGKDIVISLQDAHGLINISDRSAVERLLSTYGLDAPAQARLVDKLLDYRDKDDLRHLNGAEKAEYARDGIADELRNAELLTPSELARVHEWRDTSALWQQDPVSAHINTLPFPLFNPNNAGWRALTAATGAPEELTRSLVHNRRNSEIADITGLLYTGEVNDPFGLGGFVSSFPSSTLILTLGRVGSPFAVKMAVKQTPFLETSPWRILYTHPTAWPDAAKSVEKLPELPAAAKLRDFSVPDQLELHLF